MSSRKIFCNFAKLFLTTEFMRDKNILVVSSEVVPYLPETILSKSSFSPKEINERVDKLEFYAKVWFN